jgi:hypothetical protein
MNNIHLPKIDSLPRFFLASLLVSSILCVYMDLWPLYISLDEIKERISNVTQQIAEKEEALHSVDFHSSDISSVNRPALAAEMIAAINKSGGIAKALLIQLGEANNKQIQLQFTGSFLAIYQFWFDLSHRGWPCQLEGMVIKQQRDILEANFKFKVFPLILPIQPAEKKYLCCKRDPFHVPALMDTDIHEVMINEIHYVGYIQQENTMDALILLRNGNLIDIQLGSTIGKENWRVLKISPQTLTLIHPITRQLKTISKEEEAIV